jgi:hypothetical protein
VHENYKGRKLHFSSDIALLKLKVSLELTWAVLPVCIDWRNEYERFQLSNGNIGTVSLLVFVPYYKKMSAFFKVDYQITN